VSVGAGRRRLLAVPGDGPCDFMNSMYCQSRLPRRSSNHAAFVSRAGVRSDGVATVRDAHVVARTPSRQASSGQRLHDTGGSGDGSAWWRGDGAADVIVRGELPSSTLLQDFDASVQFVGRAAALKQVFLVSVACSRV
jgi:hypothetical protein